MIVLFFYGIQGAKVRKNSVFPFGKVPQKIETLKALLEAWLLVGWDKGIRLPGGLKLDSLGMFIGGLKKESGGAGLSYLLDLVRLIFGHPSKCWGHPIL